MEQGAWSLTPCSLLPAPHFFQAAGQQRPEIGKGVAEEAGVVADILGGGVDLVGDSGGQLSDGFQLLGLRQLGFQHSPLR